MLASTLFEVDVLIYMSLIEHQHLPADGRSRGDVHVYLQDPMLEPLMMILSD